jgi:hypothetical protein
MTWLLLLIAILSGCTVEGQPDLQQVSDGAYTAFIHVNVIPMTREIIIEDQTVLIEGDRIIAVGPGKSVSVPENATIIDGAGVYLLPGLADMHMHTRQDWEDRNIWPVHPLNLYLANGVTTIRDFAPQGSPLTYALQWRDEIRAGTRSGPTIYASGKLLYASPLGDPESIVHQNYDLGFDFLKLYSYLSKEDYHRAMQTAKALGMYTAGHIPYAVGLDGVLAEGMDEIAHVEELLPEFLAFDRDKKLTPEEWLPYTVEASLLQWDFTSSAFQADFETDNLGTMARISDQIRSADVPVCTTMVVDDVIQLKLFQPEAFLERLENIYFERGYLGSFRQGEEKHQVQFKGIEDLAAFKYGIDRWVLVELQKAGILLLLGTDSGTGGMGIVPGYSIHDELRILVENGFSPYEAIATGTVNASAVAEQMVGERDFGTVEVGRRADLLLVNENPLEDIDAIKDLRGVMAAGRWYSREELDQMIAIEEWTYD